MVTLSDEEFEQAIQDALDSIPQQLIDAMDNVAIFTQDEPEPEQLKCLDQGSISESGDLLGLYEGLPLTERGASYGDCFGDTPDAITIFKGPHERMQGSKDDILDEVFVTVIHEIGHYFGMDEEQIEEMGFN